MLGRFTNPSVRKNIEVDIQIIDHYDKLLPELEWYILKTARVHDPIALNLLKSVPGIGHILSLSILYEVQVIDRFKTVQEFLSYSRLVKCAKESAGEKYGTNGAKMGNAHLKWAFSEAVVLFLRGSNMRQKFFEKLVKKHGKAKALSMLAAKLGRAVYFMLLRRHPFDQMKFLSSD